MGTPEETAMKLVEGVGDMFKGDTDYKAQVVEQVIDKLLGTDDTALVKTIGGLPAEYFEMVTDGIVKSFGAKVREKLASPTPPETGPSV